MRMGMRMRMSVREWIIWSKWLVCVHICRHVSVYEYEYEYEGGGVEN